MAKYLNETGVSTLWNKIKSVFATKASLSATDNQVNTLVNTTRELTNRTTNLDNNKLGKTETAVKANGVVDAHDGRELKFRYGKEGNQVSEWYPMWEGNTLTCVQRELVKNDLGFNSKTNSIPVSQFPNRPSGGSEYGFAFCNNPNIAPNQDDYLLFVDSYQSAYFGVCLNAESQVTWHKLATEDQVNNAVSTANSASSTASNADAKAQQAINQINSVNQDKITKGDLVFSLSGSTLTITKRY